MLNATRECTGSLTTGRKTKKIATKTIIIGKIMKTYGRIHQLQNANVTQHKKTRLMYTKYTYSYYGTYSFTVKDFQNL